MTNPDINQAVDAYVSALNYVQDEDAIERARLNLLYTFDVTPEMMGSTKDNWHEYVINTYHDDSGVVDRDGLIKHLSNIYDYASGESERQRRHESEIERHSSYDIEQLEDAPEGYYNPGELSEVYKYMSLKPGSNAVTLTPGTYTFADGELTRVDDTEPPVVQSYRADTVPEGRIQSFVPAGDTYLWTTLDPNVAAEVAINKSDVPSDNNEKVSQFLVLEYDPKTVLDARGGKPDQYQPTYGIADKYRFDMVLWEPDIAGEVIAMIRDPSDAKLVAAYDINPITYQADRVYPRDSSLSLDDTVNKALRDVIPGLVQSRLKYAELMTNDERDHLETLLKEYRADDRMDKLTSLISNEDDTPGESVKRIAEYKTTSKPQSKSRRQGRGRLI